MIRVVELNNESDSSRLLESVGVSNEGVRYMKGKALHRALVIDKIKNQAAVILKQEMLSLGGEAAVHADVVRFDKGENSCAVLGTIKQLNKLVQKLRFQPYGLSDMAKQIKCAINNYDKNNWKLKIGKKTKTFGKNTRIMGVLNITPDSFSDGGAFYSEDDAFNRAKSLITDGADILDIGGESTRPGSIPVSSYEEMQRIIPVIKRIRKKYSIPISIDTYKADVAEKAIKAGADIINDISGLRFDSRMVDAAAKYKTPVIIMHMQGEPHSMQKNPKYGDVVADILGFFTERIKYAIKKGIKDNAIFIDPGIGFGKTLEHNLEILRRIDEFKSLGYPIVLGTSKKSFIGNILNLPVNDRFEGTLAASVYASMKNIPVLRVHDVLETYRAVRIIGAIKNGN
ncbi:MAG: dihydropteroate synthase [Elusimicrobiota bacterium]